MEKELTFGSSEWMDELKSRVKFPAMFAIYYGVDQETGKSILHSKIIDTKSVEPKNIKYGSVSRTLSMMLTRYDWLLEGVHLIESGEEYLSKLEGLAKKWNVDFE